MTSYGPRLCLLLIAPMLTLPLRAQQAPAVPPPSDSASPGSGVTFRTGAQEVNLDLVVRDSKGKIVKNVSPDQIEVYEDGVKQEVRDFRFYAGREQAKEAGAKAAPVAAVKGSTALPSLNLVCMVFHGLDPYTKKNAVDFATQFVESNLQPNTLVAMFSLGATLVPLHEFTNNKAELIHAASTALTGPSVDFTSVANAVLNASPNIATISETVSGSGATTSVSTALTITGGEINPRAINGADVSTGTGASRLRGDLADERRQLTNIDASRNFDALINLVDRLSTLPGHKSVLLLSTGITGINDPDRFSAFLRKTNKAGITFYAIDVNGLGQNSTGLAGNTAMAHTAQVSASQAGSTTSAAANMEKMRQGDYLEQGVRQSDTQAQMRDLAEATGGFLIGNTNDLRKPFQRILGDLDAHYEAVYRPTDNKNDARLRTIEVKLKRADWTVESRTGYYALPASAGNERLTPSEMMGLAALNLKETPHAFQFGSAAMRFQPSPSGAREEIVFELPAGNLAATPDPVTKKYKMHVSALALVKDSNGEVVDKFSQDSPLEVPPDALPKVAKSTLNFNHAVDLPPGHYTVEIAAVDEESRRASATRFAFDNPEPKPGVALSSISLVQRLEPVAKADSSDPFEVIPTDPAKARKVVPETLGSIGHDARPMAYFVVYPDKNNAEKPKLQVEFLVNKQVLAKQMADLPPVNSQGAIPMLVGAVNKSGDCELRVTALQGTQSMTQSLQYTVNQ